MEAALSAGVLVLVTVVDAEGDAAVGRDHQGQDAAGDPLRRGVLLRYVRDAHLIAVRTVPRSRLASPQVEAGVEVLTLLLDRDDRVRICVGVGVHGLGHHHGLGLLHHHGLLLHHRLSGLHHGLAGHRLSWLHHRLSGHGLAWWGLSVHVLNLFNY